MPVLAALLALTPGSLFEVDVPLHPKLYPQGLLPHKLSGLAKKLATQILMMPRCLVALKLEKIYSAAFN